MRATQFVRRGLIAFAAVATLSTGLAGGVGAQSPGATVDGDDAIVWVPVPGYTYDVVRTPDGERSAILALGVVGGIHPVGVQFLPDFDGAAIIDPVGEDVIAERQP
jgi:hypothetical protein